MCAIAGVAGHPEALHLAGQMASRMAHRGPDSGGRVELEPGTAFAHRRLAIVDLSEQGAQPMRSSDGRWTIVFNGEIFNYRELREDLAPRNWRGSSDTEVLLEAIADWGLERALAASIGMFAFGLWDHRDRTLTLARDRVGEKPLVYWWDGHTLAFASEMKALESLHGHRLDPQAVELYLALGYVPAPLGIFRHTAKLEAGHWLRLEQGKVRRARWWFPERASSPGAANQGERIEQLRSLVASAVRLRLRSDVPLAVALSGGLDSSIIAAELCRQGASPEAFTIAFGNQPRGLEGNQAQPNNTSRQPGEASSANADLPWARQMAALLGLSHRVLPAGEVLDSTGGGVPAMLDRVLDQYDEPFGDSSAVPSLALARAVGSNYKVVLNGDGGDEAFAGYRHYEFIGPKQMVKAAAAAVGLCDGSGTGVYVQSKAMFRARERAGLLNGHADAPINGRRGGGNALDRLLGADEFLAQQRPDALKRALWSDRHLYLANDLTFKTDMALSACGMEGRAPLLDHRILEWAQSLDNRDLVRGRQKKILLREAYRAELPPALSRRPKQGFGAPVEAWLAGPLAEQVREYLPCPLLDGELQRGRTGQRLWTLFLFARWADRWRATW